MKKNTHLWLTETETEEDTEPEIVRHPRTKPKEQKLKGLD
jgi:hypothetical protein